MDDDAIRATIATFTPTVSLETRVRSMMFLGESDSTDSTADRPAA